MPDKVATAERIRCVNELDSQGFGSAAVLLALPLVPPVASVHRWLTAHGWQAGTPGQAGALWETGDHKVGVPHQDGDPGFTLIAVQRVARAAGRPFGDVLAEMGDL
jgi:hypothetical protein